MERVVRLREQQLVRARSEVDPAEAELRRPILDRCLDGTDRLIEIASLLPGRLKSRGLKAEVSVMLSLVKALAERLRNGDP